MKTAVAAILTLMVVTALGDQPEGRFILTRTHETDDSHLIIEHYEDQANQIAQFWTADETRTHRSLLIEYHRCAVPLLSNSHKWIVVNDYSGSNMAEPLLYQRTSGVRFERVKNADLSSVAWRYMATKHGFPSNAVFDHAYSEVLCWMGESDSVLIRLWGYQSGEYALDDCYCIINAKTLAVTTDLNALSVKPYRRLQKSRPTMGTRVQVTRDGKQTENNHRAGSLVPQP